MKEEFEANHLDGDKIDECGNAMFSAHGAFDVYKDAKNRAFVEIWEESPKFLKVNKGDTTRDLRDRVSEYLFNKALKEKDE